MELIICCDTERSDQIAIVYNNYDTNILSILGKTYRRKLHFSEDLNDFSNLGIEGNELKDH